jgi:tripartite ATP-independent transporter DctM subunit
MKNKGYSPAYAASVVSSASSLAIIIPPSIPMILYAVIAGCSVEQLFVAGFVPGFLGGFLMMAVSYIYAKRKNLPIEESFNIKNIKRTAKEAGLTFILPIIILGGIFGGFVTATEAAGLAVFASLGIAYLYKEFNLKQFFESTVEGGSQTATVMLLVASSMLLGEFLTMEQIPQKIASSLTTLTQSKYLILAILNVFLFIIGFFLHSAAAIILVVPVVMPLINSLGIDPVHFGIIVTLNLAIGQQTPPVASVLAVACSIAKVDMWTATKVNIIFISVLIFILLLCTYVPIVPMSLVQYFYR